MARMAVLHVAHFELVHVSFHGYFAAAFESVVGTDVEHPVVDRAGERFVVAEVVAQECGIGGSHEVGGLLVADLLVGEYALGLGVEHIVAGSRSHTC